MSEDARGADSGSSPKKNETAMSEDARGADSEACL